MLNRLGKLMSGELLYLIWLAVGVASLGTLLRGHDGPWKLRHSVFGKALFHQGTVVYRD